MKNSTFTKTTLAIFMALSFTACSHSLPANDNSAKPVVPKKDNDVSKNALKAKEKAEKELAAANAKISALTKEITELKKNGQDVSTLEAELEKAKNSASVFDKKVKVLNAKIKELEKNSSDAKSSLEELKASHEATIKGIKVQLKEAKQNTVDAKANLDTANSKVKALELELKNAYDSVNGSKAKLQEQVAAAKKEAATAKEALDIAKKDAVNMQKALDTAKKDAANKQKVLEAALKDAEDKLKDLQRAEEYRDGTVAYQVETALAAATDATTPRGVYQSQFDDKFDWKKVFEADLGVDSTHNDLTAPIGVDINGKELTIQRHDLANSSIGTIKGEINTYIGKNTWGESVQNTGYTTVLAVAGKPTDLTKTSFNELKAQNKGELTYQGRGLYNVHLKEIQGTTGYSANKKLGTLEKMDVLKSDNSWANSTFKVNLETAKISGEMAFGSTNPLTVTLAETDILEKDNQLQFAGNVTATQDTSVTEPAWDGGEVTYSTNHILKDGKGTGTYDGSFMGANAEELAGKFNIQQDYKRDDKKDSKYADEYAGKYTKFGDVNGVFNAKKIEAKPAQDYKPKK